MYYRFLHLCVRMFTDLEMGLSSLLTQLVMEEKLDLAVDFTIKAYNLGMSDSLYYSVDTFTYRILIVETVKAGSDAFFPLLKSASLHTSTYDANLQVSIPQFQLICTIYSRVGSFYVNVGIL